MATAASTSEPRLDAIAETIAAPRVERKTAVDASSQLTSEAAMVPPSPPPPLTVATVRPSITEVGMSRNDGFFATFGVLGVPMVLAFLLSAIAMFNQAAIQSDAESYLNVLTKTSRYDDGEFWFLDAPDRATMVVATVVLVLFGCLYVALAAFMVCFRHRAIPTRATAVVPPRSNRPTSKALYAESRGSLTDAASDASTMDVTFRDIVRSAIATRFGFAMQRSSGTESEATADAGNGSVVPATSKVQSDDRKGSRRSTYVIQQSTRKAKSAAQIYAQFSDIDGVYHTYYSASYDLPKLIFQTATLIEYLHMGFPGAVITFYTSALTVNWLISFYRFQLKTFDRGLVVARAFYLFDLFFAVFEPLAIILYALTHLRLDHAVMDTRLEALSTGVFDRSVRLFVDPQEVANFRVGFAHMQLVTVSTIVIKGGLLYLSIYKWRKIIRYLIQTRHKERLLAQLVLQKQQLTANNATIPPYKVPQIHRRHAKHHVALGVVLFLVTSGAILLYTAMAYATVAKNCTGHPHCAVVSYGWHAGDGDCPCLVYIDRKLDPRTYDEWTHPPDATRGLASAARAGKLKVVQIVNRAVPTLPDELRLCKASLQQLILIYTRTEIVPPWIRDLEHMRYFHVEGDFSSGGLRELPIDAFQQMHALRYLHTGVLPLLVKYPSLDGLHSLHSLTITSATSLFELPSFDDLTSLHTLHLVDNHNLQRLPSLHALAYTLRCFVLQYRSELCCNGYLSRGVCELENPHCVKHSNDPAVASCSNESMALRDQALLNRIDADFCSANAHDLDDFAPTLQTTDGVCGGVLYRQCEAFNATGMCFNARMEVVQCDVSGEYERMRRQQIARGVGDACDPVVEAWLGCVKR